MSDLHPALAFLRERMKRGQAVDRDTLRLDIEAARLEIFTVADAGSRSFFDAGNTRLSYRCTSDLSDSAKQSLRNVLREIQQILGDARVSGLDESLPDTGGWTDSLGEQDPASWRDWVVRNYRASIEAGRQQERCTGLPDCLDLRMRPPIQPPAMSLAAVPARGPCADCGRARACHAAREASGDRLKPLRHADALTAELAALRTLASATSVPLERALEAYTRLTEACGDRNVEGALPLEYSVRLSRGARTPDRLRFVSYYPLVTSDSLRREVSRARGQAVRDLATLWLGENETAALDRWLECAAQTQPDTLGLSIGMDLDAARQRLQVYAHPEPNESGRRFVAAVVERLGGDDRPTQDNPAVLVALALAAGEAPALKIYHHRSWAERGDTGLLPDGMADLDSFNPGWGLAIREHISGRSSWVKWDFPVTTHFQDYERFLDAFWKANACGEASAPEWLSGSTFSPWPTWASLGRGGWALYFQAR